MRPGEDLPCPTEAACPAPCEPTRQRAESVRDQHLAQGRPTRAARAGRWIDRARDAPRAPTILGAARLGAQVIVWWRLDASRTALEALDATSARSRWQRAGPSWAWDATIAAHGAEVALLAGGEVAVFETASG